MMACTGVVESLERSGFGRGLSIKLVRRNEIDTQNFLLGQPCGWLSLTRMGNVCRTRQSLQIDPGLSHPLQPFLYSDVICSHKATQEPLLRCKLHP